MPNLEVEFFSGYRNEWDESDLTYRFESIAEVAAEISRMGREMAYRARFPGDEDWQFVPTNAHPHRFMDSAGTHWQYGDSPLIAWPVTDLLTRKVITEQMCMPPAKENTMPASPATSAKPDVPTSSPRALVDLKVKRHDGRLVLAVNAKPLHDLLDAMGCKTQGAAYVDPPTAGSTVIRDGKVSPTLFLTKEYPMCVNLGQYYSRPPTMRELRELCESAHDAVETILDHYQPVDISYTVQKMVK